MIYPENIEKRFASIYRHLQEQCALPEDTVLTGTVLDRPKHFRGGQTVFKLKCDTGVITVYMPQHGTNIRQWETVTLRGDYRLYQPAYAKDTVQIQFSANTLITRHRQKAPAQVKRRRRRRRLSFRGRKTVSIALVTSAHSEARLDIQNNLHRYYTLEEQFVNLLDPHAIARAISAVEETDVDVVLISRGGVDGLHVFNHLAVTEAVGKSSKIVVTALGHAGFRSAADALADYSYDTPSQAAQTLSELRRRHVRHKWYRRLAAAVAIGAYTWIQWGI